MEQYIKKSALVAEIKKIIPSEPYPRTSETLYGAETYGKRGMCFRILDLIDTLEVKEEVLNRNDKTKLMQKCVKATYKRGYDMGVLQTTNKMNSNTKEVDLEKDVESYWKQCDLSWCIDAYNMTHMRSMLSDIAKHFFELGLKTQKGEQNMKTGIELIAEERQRQIEAEGWTKEHDAQHKDCELVKAAICYADPNVYYHRENRVLKHRIPNWNFWPIQWDMNWFKPTDRIRDLVKAGALIAAEIDRLQAQKG